MKKPITAFALLLSVHAFAQKTVYVSAADSFRQTGNIHAALREYHAIYTKNPQDARNYYGFACALAADAAYSDAFKYLYLANSNDPTIIPLTDPALLNLRSNGAWTAYEDAVIKQVAAKDGALKKLPVAKQLWEMKALDALYYHDIELLQEMLGKDAAVINQLWQAKAGINLQNQKKLEQITDAGGWPHQSEVGKEAAEAAVLIVEHAGAAVKKKYLPAIKTACEAHEASWEHYAVIYDQLMAAEKKKQLYGTLVTKDFVTGMYSLHPLEDAANVDQRRQELGLKPLSVYLRQWNINYTPPSK